jgi:hypothetical protein
MDMRDKLAQELQVNRHNDEVPAEFLRRPVLHKATSRFTAGSIADEK